MDEVVINLDHEAIEKLADELRTYFRKNHVKKIRGV